MKLCNPAQSLAGATALLEFDGVAMVADVHVAIRGRYGIPIDRQSLVIAGGQPCQPPSAAPCTCGVDALCNPFACSTGLLSGEDLSAQAAFVHEA